MKLIVTALIAATTLVVLLTAAEAAPRKVPVVLPANANLHVVSIRHNSIRLHIPAQVRFINR